MDDELKNAIKIVLDNGLYVAKTRRSNGMIRTEHAPKYLQEDHKNKQYLLWHASGGVSNDDFSFDELVEKMIE